MTVLLWILIVLNTAMLVAGWRLYRRSGRRTEAGTIAGAEVQLAARHLRDLEARERWRALDLERLHPLNRSEVVGLLRRLDGGPAALLAAQERAFLDRMVEAEERALRSDSSRATRSPHMRQAVAGP